MHIAVARLRDLHGVILLSENRISTPSLLKQRARLDKPY